MKPNVKRSRCIAVSFLIICFCFCFFVLFLFLIFSVEANWKKALFSLFYLSLLFLEKSSWYKAIYTIWWDYSIFRWEYQIGNRWEFPKNWDLIFKVGPWAPRHTMNFAFMELCPTKRCLLWYIYVPDW